MALRIPFLRLAALCALLALPLAELHADELRLADGSVIKGTIVGFDDNSFKVETSYGFAYVRKDQVVTISVHGSANPAAPESKSEPVVAPAPKPAPSTEITASPAVAKTSEKSLAPVPPTTVISKLPENRAAAASTSEWKAGPPPPLPGATAVAPRASVSDSPVTKSSTAKVPVASPLSPSTVAAPAVPVPSPAQVPQANAVASAAPAPTRAAAPAIVAVPGVAARPPAPEAIRETVSGNTYLNNSYRFQMYKPPGWQVLAAARTVLPGAIAALGTDDQETYLLIGQETAGKPLYLAAEAADKRLRDVMDNFRPQGQEQMLVAGAWATAHRFRGNVDLHDWSGVVVLVPHGSRLYTIFGMTRADTDLVQIQENVIARAIASIEFTD